jgi:hypothetical protein
LCDSNDTSFDQSKEKLMMSSYEKKKMRTFTAAGRCDGTLFNGGMLPGG